MCQFPPTMSRLTYTTLFRSETDEQIRVMEAAKTRIDLRKAIETEMHKQTYDGPSDAPRMVNRFLAKPTRSEEHTSELQSRFDLVCRILLENKINISSSSCS